MRLGRISQWFAPGYSWCVRCKTSWRFIEPHVTPYTGNVYEGGRGAFALCEKCWQESSLPERIAYYIDRFGGQEEWPLIKAAVRSGK